MAKLLWDVVNSGIALWVVVLLSHKLGIQNFGTKWGAIAFSGINFLGLAIIGMGFELSRKIFGLETFDQQEKSFVLSGIVGFCCSMLTIFYAFKWIGMLIGFVKPGAPSQYLMWLFQ